MKKSGNLGHLVTNLGAGWVSFRLGYAIRRRLGMLARKYPAYRWEDRPLAKWLKPGIPFEPSEYAIWRKKNAPKFFPGVDTPLSKRPYWDVQTAVKEADRILKGEFKYFDHLWMKVGFPPDWFKDPLTGVRVASEEHWSKIADDGEYEVKFLWEASRFSAIYMLVRGYATHHDERFAEAFWDLIEDWAQKNPPGIGVHWKDGQEIALRLMAWVFGWYGFRNSPSSTPQRTEQFTVYVAAQAQRICQNLDFALATQSNHGISEAFALWLMGLLFPELKDAEKYHALGRELLEKQAGEQLLADGTYSMYSLNYQRFVLHILFAALQLGKLNHEEFSSEFKNRLKASVRFLSKLIDPASGQMPGFGSDDGALVLPLNNCDYSDYRPLLQLGNVLLNSKPLFEPGPWDEDLFWLFGKQEFGKAADLGHSEPREGFNQGGIYLLRDAHSKAILRCTQYASRPSHADQLHVDLWWKGIPLACDAGTYLYHGKEPWQNGLARTDVHNTVTVDGGDQMLRVSRFTWVDWAKGRLLPVESFQGYPSWIGEQDGYKRLKDPVSHRRAVIGLGEDRWFVLDWLNGKQSHHYRLHWLLADFHHAINDLENSIVLKTAGSRAQVQVGIMDGDGKFSVVIADPNSTRGWRSQHYGEKEPALSLALEQDARQVCFWTFIGPASEEVFTTPHSIGIKHSKILLDLENSPFTEK